MKGRFDVVVGNPPRLTYKDVGRCLMRPPQLPSEEVSDRCRMTNDPWPGMIRKTPRPGKLT